MRLAPVPLAFQQNIALAIHNAGESSRVTHAAPVAVAACRYFAGLLLGALEGRPKEQLLSSFFYPGFERDHWHRQPLPDEIAKIANGSFKLKEPPEITGSGFVVRDVFGRRLAENDPPRHVGFRTAEITGFQIDDDTFYSNPHRCPTTLEVPPAELQSF